MSDSGDLRDITAADDIEPSVDAAPAPVAEGASSGGGGDVKEDEGEGATVDVAGAQSLIRDAYKSKDVEASRAAHAKPHLEDHGGAGADFIKSIVFGGLDGIITTFAIIAAVAGADLDMKVIILMGFSNLIADAISMGLGDFLSSKAENEHIMAERAKEMWEYKRIPDMEIAEMIEIYEKKGYDPEDARTIINTMTSKEKYADLFVDHMMIEELGLQVPDEDDNPAKDGFVTFLAFVAFGSVPVLLYVIFFAAGFESRTGTFVIACFATAATMFALGATKAKITKLDTAGVIKSGLLMMLNGTLAAAAAYLIGWGLEVALDVKAECG